MRNAATGAVLQENIEDTTDSTTAEKAHNMRMTQPAGRLNFAQKLFARLIIYLHFGEEHFDRCLLASFFVLYQIHSSHPSNADLLPNLIVGKVNGLLNAPDLGIKCDS